jgi:riboflavin transporter FmnP
LTLMAGPEADAAPDALGPDPGSPPRSRLRSALLGIGIGTGVGVAAVAIAFSIVAIPLYIVASTEPGSGLDRTLVRRGLFHLALPFGLVTGIAVGIAIGVWYARGGRLPNDRTPIHD